MSERKSLSELAQMCRTQNNIYRGTYWRHYGGDFYVINGFGVDEETNELEVQYSPVQVQTTSYGYKIEDSERLEGLAFHRPRSKFFSDTYADGKKVPRFRRVEMISVLGK